MSELPIRIGVVGLGLIAQGVHLPNLETLRDQFTVTHVCDASLDRAASVADRLPGSVRASTRFIDVLTDPDVDAVLILTPGSHGDIVLAALEQGKDVFVEKPLAYSLAEIHELREAQVASGRVVQVGTMKAHDPLVPAARDALGRIGRLAVVRVTVIHPTDECQFEHIRLLNAPAPDPAVTSEAEAYSLRRAREAMGDDADGPRSLYTDVLLGSVIHEAALLRALGLGLPRTTDFACVDPPLSETPASQPPRLLAVGVLPGGAQLQLSWTWAPDFPEYVEEVMAIGIAGRMRLTMPGPYLPAHRSALTVESMVDGQRTVATTQPHHSTAFVEELRAFAASVRSGAPNVCTIEGAGEDLTFLQQVARAAANQAGLPVGGEAGQGTDS